MRGQRGEINVVAVVLVVMGTLLAVSVAGNAYFWHERDGLVQREATVKQLQEDTRAAANECKASVVDLGKKTAQQGAKIQADIAGIAPQVGKLQLDSIAAVQAKPDDPKDLCGSLGRFFRRQAP